MILLSSSHVSSFIQLLGVLLIFLFVLVITYFTTKWIGVISERSRCPDAAFRWSIPIRIDQQQTGSGNKSMGDVYLVIAVAKDDDDHARKAYRGRDRDLRRQRSATERLPDRMEKKVR